jgi:Methyltransferase domain
MAHEGTAMAHLISTGIKTVDHYLANGFGKVEGYSSRFSATICGHLLRRQTELGIAGSAAEIGTYEGRFFIAMGLALAAGKPGRELAYGFDLFAWPGSPLLERFLANVDANGLSRERVVSVAADTLKLTPPEFARATGGKPLRFIHIDGDHAPASLAHDLSLAHASLHPKGLICIDDMLHPAFPFLVVVVHDYLKQHPDMRLLCVIDREDIVGAPKFLLCRADAVALYETDLMATFKAQHLTIGGDAMGKICVILTPNPTPTRV